MTRTIPILATLALASCANWSRPRDDGTLPGTVTPVIDGHRA